MSVAAGLSAYFLSLSVALSVCLLVSLSNCRSIYLSFRLSVVLSGCLSFGQSVCVLVCRCQSVGLFVSGCLCVNLPLSNFQSVRRTTCLSICYSFHPPTIFFPLMLSAFRPFVEKEELEG